MISTPPELFRRQIEYLVENRVPVVRLADVRRTPGAVALTFDDGFRNFLEYGLPVLERYHLPATVFAVSGHCGRQNDWSARSGISVPSLPLMSWDGLKEIAGAGIDLGAHSIHHPDLTRLTREQAEGELRDCRAELEDRTGRTVESVAYPYGSSTPAVRQLAQRYFRLGCGTSLRFVSARADLFDLPRLDVYYLRNDLWFEKAARGGGSAYIALRSFFRRLRWRG